ncbi:MAG: V-type ATP synthase subunit I [Christensenellaceae bacterium]|nr:V-type ATP synthase subunit I [Christensenellaceae bacterium]
MAIVDMKKLTLVGYGKDKSSILRNLEKTGCVEIQRSGILEKTFTREEAGNRDTVNGNLMRLQFVFDFLKSEERSAKNVKKAEAKAEKNKTPVPEEDKLDYTPKKKKLFNPVQRIAFEDFYSIAGREDEIMSKVGRLEEISRSYADIKSEISKLQATALQLEVFRPVAVRLSAFRDTRHTAIVLGAVNASKRQAADKAKEKFPASYIEVGEGGNLVPVAIVALKEDIDGIIEILNEAEFIRTSFSFDNTAEEKIREIEYDVKELQKKKQALLEESLTYEDSVPEFRQLYDYYRIAAARIEAEDGFALTKSSFILEGWFPAESEEKVIDAVHAATDAVVIETRDPVSGDSVPTLTKNNKIVAPYETITNMYSPPSYHDVDPNGFVAFFYFLIFGVMMGDAVYGLILMLGGFLGYYLSKPAPGKGKMFLVIGMGGISTFIWGVLFGGWMGFDVSGTFLEKLIWFKPIDETNSNTALYMLGLSLAIGVLQINVSIGVRAYDLIKNKKDILGAFNEAFSWYFILLGIIFIALNKLLKLADGFMTAGIVCAAIGVALILLLGGRGKKGVKRVFGGFSQLYGGVNFLSDILSYSRLFGLGLSTAVIGMVVNEICKVIISLLTINGVAVLGVIVAAPIFIIGHVFNVSINTLGTYIHDARLQFIEFFSRFYEGGGHVFKPLGSDTKYTYIEK